MANFSKGGTQRRRTNKQTNRCGGNDAVHHTQKAPTMPHWLTGTPQSRFQSPVSGRRRGRVCVTDKFQLHLNKTDAWSLGAGKWRACVCVCV